MYTLLYEVIDFFERNISLECFQLTNLTITCLLSVVLLRPKQYIMQLPGQLLSPSSKNFLKNPPRKKTLMFQGKKLKQLHKTLLRETGCLSIQFFNSPPFLIYHPFQNTVS